jgi:hypothetical protein
MAKATEIAGRFPRLRARLIEAPTDYAAAPDDTFAFGLNVILGLAAGIVKDA